MEAAMVARTITAFVQAPLADLATACAAQVGFKLERLDSLQSWAPENWGDIRLVVLDGHFDLEQLPWSLRGRAIVIREEKFEPADMVVFHELGYRRVCRYEELTQLMRELLSDDLSKMARAGLDGG